MSGAYSHFLSPSTRMQRSTSWSRPTQRRGGFIWNGFVTRIRENPVISRGGHPHSHTASLLVTLQCDLGIFWTIGAWRGTVGHRDKQTSAQWLRGRVEIRCLERSWGGPLGFHSIPRSTLCPLPTFKGNSDHSPLTAFWTKFPCSTKRLTRRKLLCLRSEERAFAAEAKVPVAHPAPVLAIRARLVALVVGAVCRTSTTSDTVSAYRVPAV